jgi:hypothetical protein
MLPGSEKSGRVQEHECKSRDQIRSVFQYFKAEATLARSLGHNTIAGLSVCHNRFYSHHFN